MFFNQADKFCKYNFPGSITVFFLILVFPVISSSGEINFRADQVKYRMKDNRTTCIGNAVISNTNILIRAQKIVLEGSEMDFVRCYNDVFIDDYNSDVRLRSDYLEFDQKKDYIRLLRNPEMESQDLHITGDVLERYNNREIFLAQGNLLIIKDDRRIRCHLARYFEGQEKIVLTGNPEVRIIHDSGAEDVYRAGQIIYLNDTDTILLSGSVKGTVFPDERKDSAED